jgi:predicted acetyltransferase
MINVNLKKAELSDKLILDNLLQFYMYDFTQFLDFDLSDEGLYKKYIVDDYFINPEKSAFLVRIDNKLAGFVLVSAETILTQNQGGKCVKEFFVMRRYRRKGIGRIVASKIWDLYPGKWEMKVERTNKSAQQFWEAAIRDYPNKEGFRKQECNTHGWSGVVFSLTAYRA